MKYIVNFLESEGSEKEEIKEDVSLDLSKDHITDNELEQLLGFKPKNVSIYKTALVHKSIQKDIKQNEESGLQVLSYMKESYERLEFLGDAVLNLVVAEILYNKYPDKDEGFMTRLRTKIVRSSNCINFAKLIKLGHYILTGFSTTKIKDDNGYIINDKILEDSFESLLGAIYKDQNLDIAKKFLEPLMSSLNYNDLISNDDNYKDILMRFTQVSNYELPIYNVLLVQGPPYDRKFTIGLSLKSITGTYRSNIGTGTASTKRLAEQEACKNSICMNINCNCNKIHYNEIEDIINRKKINRA